MFSSKLLARSNVLYQKIVRNSSVKSNVHYLPRGEHNAVAYRSIEGDNPGIIFCPGFQSNMQGVKALALEAYCKKRGLAYTRFDYQGCGDSTGDIRDVLFSTWKDDLTSIIDNVTAGPQILVGSSMGAWLALLAAMERPHRLHSLIGLSSAPDFAQRKFENLSEKELGELSKQGETVIRSEWGTYVITQKFLSELPRFNLLDRDRLPIHVPVRLIHGMKDALVPYSVAIALANKIASDDILTILRKKGEHRLSQPEDITLLFEELDYLIQGSAEVKDLALSSWASFSVYSHPDHMITDRMTVQ